MFKLTRTGETTAELTVQVTVSESALMVDGVAAATVTFAAGSASATLSVATEDDEAAEDASTVTATVSPGTGYTVDGASGSAEVVVEDDDAAPVVVTASPIVVAENGTAVATLAATDEDTAAEDLSWSIPAGAAGGADGAKFALTAGGELTFGSSKDFEAPDDSDTNGTYEVAVAVTDGTNTTTASLEVALANVNEAPVADAGDDLTVVAASSTVTLDGDASSDPDANDTLTYEWTQTDTSGHTVALSDAAVAKPTFTAPPGLTADAALSFKLVVSDAEGLTGEDTVNVTVVPLPTISIAGPSGAATEGGEAMFKLTRTGETTAELTVQVTVSESALMVDGVAAATVTFAAGSASATLSVATEDDEAAEDASTVTATVSPGTGYTVDGASGSAEVVVEDDDAAPVVVTASPIVVAENGTAVATLAATDEDTAAEDLSWSIPAGAAGGADGAKFALTAGGELTFGSSKDFEAPDDSDTDGEYEVTVQVTDGSNPVDAALVVQLSDVDDVAPMLSSASVDGDELTLTFREVLDGDSVPPGSSFAATVAGSARTVDAVALSGDAVTLTLSSAVMAGETVTVGYSPPEGGQIRDLAENAAVAFADRAVANETPEPDNHVPTGRPTIGGTAQVGRTLTASADGIADADGLGGAAFAWQWISNDGSADTEIAGATGSSYTPVAADEGRTIKVRAIFTDDGGTEETLTGEATAPVWPAPVNPPLAAGEEELLSATVTLGWYRSPFWNAGYSRLPDASFGEMDGASFEDGGTTRAVNLFAVNSIGQFTLATGATLPEAAGLVAYWNGYRISQLEAETLKQGGVPVLVGRTPQPRDEYQRYGEGASDGVRVAVSLRRVSAPLQVTGASVTSDPGDNGTWNTGETVTAEVRFSGTVDVEGLPGASPTLAILLDGTRRQATYEDGSGTDTLTFSHTVTAADNDARHARVAANGLSLNGASLEGPNGSEVETGFSIAPLVTGVELVADESEDGSWTPGETVEVRLTFSEAVTVADGTPTVGIAIDGAASTLDYASGSGSATLVFSKSVTGSDGTLTAIAVTADSLALNGATIVSVASGVAAGLAHDGTTPAPGTGATGLTAEFLDLPESHGGALFTFRLRFSEEFLLSWKTLKGYGDTPSAFQFANGSMTGISRATQGENREWNVTVTPSGSGDVSITLPATTDCTASNAICTADDRALSAAVTARVPQTAPVQSQVQVTPLTVAFEVSPPGEHDGASEFTFHIAFSEDLDGYSWRTLRDTSLRVQQGTSRLTPYVRRLVQGSNRRWEVTVTPSSKEDVTIGIGPGPACTDAAAMCTSGGTAVSNAIGTTVLGPPGLSVADARVTEAAGATLDFAVTLSRAAAATVTVDYATSDGTATAGTDYTAASGTLSFGAGERSKTVSVAVLDDDHDEDEETFTLTLSNPSGGNAYLADGEATGTIENTDAMPRAWLARFGRTVADQVIEAVEGRFSAPRTAGAEVTLAGQRIGWSGAAPDDPGSGSGAGVAGEEARAKLAGEQEARGKLEAMTNWLRGTETANGNGTARAGHDSRSVTPREILTGSSFALTGEAKAGGTVSLWGRGAVSRFDGRDGDLSLDGEVVSAMLGADWARERWTAGLLVSRSVGEGGYRGQGNGTVSSTLTALFPYGRYAANDRVTVWGIAGYGAGELTLTPGPAPDADPGGQSAMRTDMDLAMGAVGLRGVAVQAPAEGGVELAVKTDAMAVRTTSEKTQGLAAAEADVTRLRLGLEGTWRGLKLGTGTLAPTAEIGVRHDGGDAETGFGIDLGVGFSWSDPQSGITAELRGRGLLTHESEGFRDRGISGSFAWDPGQGSGRGPKVALTRTMGASATGGMNALLGHRHLGGLAANDPGADSGAGSDDLANRRLELRMGYGYSVLEGRFTMTPEFGLGLSNGRREYSLGWRLRREMRGDIGALEFALEARRQESANDNADAEHSAGVRITARW